MKRFASAIINLKIGDEININKVTEKLASAGYERVHTTVSTGQYSVRGEVIDIYPCMANKPIRVNLGFDEIEKIKSFDPQSQLTINEEFKLFNIYPMNEMIVDFDLFDFEKKLLEIEDSNYIKEDFMKIYEYGSTNKNTN